MSHSGAGRWSDRSTAAKPTRSRPAAPGPRPAGRALDGLHEGVPTAGQRMPWWCCAGYGSWAKTAVTQF